MLYLGGGLRMGRGGLGDLDADLEADLKAHRPPGGVHVGIPNNSAYRQTMPYEMHYPGP